ncbi:MAG TPA: alpha/beta hydrolase [Chthoniobacterales bacterium]|nr:alpha/beta hydrolase [Chthoniobacterales bacterium]
MERLVVRMKEVYSPNGSVAIVRPREVTARVGVMDVRGALLRLDGGGQIAYDEYGDPEGQPVIFCHGWPSSRSGARLTDAAARKLGVRIISPDRPGISDSTFQAGRTVLDWSEIIRALAVHLALERFHILAISGGAPYAYATALRFPDQVIALAVVSGAPPIAELEDHEGLLPIHRRLLALHSRRPDLLRALFRIVRPFALFRPPLRSMLLRLLQPCDAAVLRDRASFDAFFESSRRAWRGSAQGVMTDGVIYAQPWGFGPEEILAPVRLWHGKKDRTFSCRLAQELAPRFPRATLRLVEEAGHYSLPIRHIEEILADLIATG